MMQPEFDNKPKSKHRKSTCAGCRRRKSKCDGKIPKCTTCVAYKDECHYDKPPSLAYVRSLEEEIQELKVQLRQARNQVWLPRTVSNDEKNLHSASPASDIASASYHSGTPVNNLPHRHRSVKWETDISVDDDGSVTFHNPTSAVHEPASTERRMSSRSIGETLAMVDSNSQETLRIRRELVMNASQQRQLEPFAIANSAAKVNMPKEISQELMKYHWCWIHPLFVFVYRPAFTKGMTMLAFETPDALNPIYFSETLLRVIHAHCARFLNHDVYQHQYQSVLNQANSVTTTISAQEFMQKMTEEARYGLGMDMLKQSSIPTIQALLQQSAREIVFGKSSQAWTFAGVAFRMALDMGIHLPSDKLQSFVKSLTAEDIEVRKRLFWSCYTWDKILSLYLGRMPGFSQFASEDIPLTFMDDYSDNDLWAPYYGETPKPDHANGPNYPPCPGYVISCFSQLCRLCVILNDMMQNIYSSEAAARRDTDSNDNEESTPEAKASNEEPFIRISRDLREWLVSLPPHLHISLDSPPPLAPPVHIMSLNLLYHTTVILLHRPIILGNRDLTMPAVLRSYQTCVHATAAIHDLLMLQANTFGLSHVSYLNAYSAYIAATIAVLRFEREYRPGEDQALAAQNIGLHFLLEVLQRTANAMPALERSNAIIRKRTKAVLDYQAGTQFHQHQPAAGVFPTTLAGQETFSMPTTTLQLDLAQPTAFQTISNPTFDPMSWHQQQQREMQNNGMYSEPSTVAMIEDFLPAFPGQQFPVGSEHSFGSNDVVDAQSRAALMGFNLDPHPRLNAGDIDWGFVEGFDGRGGQM